MLLYYCISESNKSNLIHLFSTVNADLALVSDWFKANKLVLNANKTKYVLFSHAGKNMDSMNMNLTIDSVALERKAYVKFLGIYIDQHLKWHQHIDHIHTKLSRATYVLRSMKKYIYKYDLKRLYYSIVYTHLIYGIEAWGAASKSIINKIEVAQKKVITESGHCLAHSSQQMHLHNKDSLPTPLKGLFIRNPHNHSYETRKKALPRLIRIASKGCKVVGGHQLNQACATLAPQTSSLTIINGFC